MKLFGFFWAAVCTVAAVRANPLGLAEWMQTVEAEFATSIDAAKSELRCRDLPMGMTRAFGCRWDDANVLHAAKCEMMARAGVKGTFFVNGGNAKFYTDVAPKLIASGHAIGNHGLGHAFMQEISPNNAWREILEQRIELETRLDVPVVSYAAPFGWPFTPDPERKELIARMLLASGHYVSGDCGVREKNWKLPECWYGLARFSANDGKPDPEEFVRQLGWSEAYLAKNPDVRNLVFGIHAGCDATGDKVQEELLKGLVAKHPDWWGATCAEYGAARYSADYARVRKVRTQGTKAVWEVVRFRPVDLGAAVPTMYDFTVAPVRVKMSPEPERLGFAAARADAKGVADKTPGIRLAVAPDPARAALAVTVENVSGREISDVTGVAYAPPEWTDQRFAFSIGKLASGQIWKKSFALSFTGREDYREGDALYAASVDWPDKGTVHRLYATALVRSAVVSSKMTPRDTALTMGPFDVRSFDEAAWLARSRPGAELPDVGSAKNERWIRFSDPNRHALTVYVNMPYATPHDPEYRKLTHPFLGEKGVRLLAVEFTAPDDAESTLYSTFAQHGGKAVIYLNGVKYHVTSAAMPIPVVRGVNRIIANVPLEGDGFPTSEQMTVCRGGLANPLTFRAIREESNPPVSVRDWLEVEPAARLRIGTKPFNVDLSTADWKAGARLGRPGAATVDKKEPLPGGGYEAVGRIRLAGDELALRERLEVEDARHARLAIEVGDGRKPFGLGWAVMSAIFGNAEWRRGDVLLDGKVVPVPSDKPNLTVQGVREIVLPAQGGKVRMKGLFDVILMDISKSSYAPDSMTLRIYARPGSGKAVTRVAWKMDLAYEPDRGTQLDLRAAMNVGFRDDIAGDGKGGWSDQGPDNDLRTVPVGERSCDNIVFDIVDPAKNGGRSCIALRGVHAPAYPKSREVVFADPVRGRFLNLLHAIAFPTGRKTGRIVATFADGYRQEIDVTDNQQVGNFWHPSPMRETALGWSGRNGSTEVGLHVTRFALERSGLVRLAFESVGEGSTWMIVAATVTSEKVPSVEKRKLVLAADGEWLPIEGRTRVKDGSALDFSFLLDAPAGKYGFARAGKSGSLVFERCPDVPVRLYGCNLCFDANFLSDRALIDAMVDDFARLGYNIVRFHHYDGCLLRREGGYMEMDAKKLDAMDYTFAQMKKRGIYATMDLFIHRDANLWPVKGYEKEKVDRGSHKALIWAHEGFNRQFIDYALALMSHVNPYTGLKWGEDPALIDIDCVNEDAITWTVLGKYAKPVYEKLFGEWAARTGVSEGELAADRSRQWNRFLVDFYPTAYRKTEAQLRAAGVKPMLTDQNHGTQILGLLTREPYGVVENHFYYWHPRSLKGAWGLPAAVGTTSSKVGLESELMGMAMTRDIKRPFLVTEWDYVHPMPYAGEGALLCGAYAALQDWDALVRFEWAHKEKDLAAGESAGEWFDIVGDPTRQMSERMAACLYTRGDVRKSDVCVPVLVSRLHFDELGARTDLDIVARRIGLVAKTGCVLFTPGEKLPLPEGVRAVITCDRAGVEAAENAGLVHVDANDGATAFAALVRAGVLPADCENAAARTYRSHTGELAINAGAPSFHVATPRSEGFSLEAGAAEKGRFADVTLKRHHGVFFVAALGEDRLVDASRYLLMHTTRQLATGIEFESDDMSVQLSYGTLPLLVRRGEAEVTLDRDLRGFRLFALRPDGARGDALPMSVVDGKTTFVLSTAKALAYELVRSDAVGDVIIRSTTTRERDALETHGVPEKVKERIELLRDGDLSKHWYVWLKGEGRDSDPKKVFAAAVSPFAVGAECERGVAIHSATTNGVEVRWFEEMVPMKDGVHLYTYGALPPDGETRGIVFRRNPYAKEELVDMPSYALSRRDALRRGYAYVEQHVRGTGMSEGVWVPYEDERKDGLAMLEWLRRLPHYGGEIFLSGESYLSSVHFSYLGTNPPDVKGAALFIQDVNRYNIAYRNGFFKIGLHGGWFVGGYRKKDKSLCRNGNVTLADFPLSDFSRRYWGEAVPALDNKIRHPLPDDPYWRSGEAGSGADYLDAISGSTMPILLKTGFYDIYTDGICEMWRGMSATRRSNCALVIDAYDHGGRMAQWAKGTRGEFPCGSRDDAGISDLDWFDYCRTGKPSENAKPGRTRYYALWENAWKDEPELADGTRRVRLALGAGARTWGYDPKRPLPQFPGSGGIAFGGMQLQPPPNFRDDVASFVLPPVEERMDVRGRITAELAVSSDCEDTCFYVRVSVDKGDGKWYLLRDDITSLSFAGGKYVPGTERSIAFRFADHAFRLEKGDILRVDVSSANSQFAPHPNVAGDAFACTRPRVAHNTVYPERSSLVLPVAPVNRGLSGCVGL